METSFWFDTIKLGWSIVYTVLRGHRLQFPNKIVFYSQMIVFALASSVDPDEMLHYAAFQLDLHCLPKYSLRVTSIRRVKSDSYYLFLVSLT